MKISHDSATIQRRRRRLRTVAVLPTLLTLGNMLCGFAAIYLCILGAVDSFTNVLPGAKVTLNNPVMEDLLPTYISVAGFLILLGMFFDMMDGRVARMTTGKTNFGGQLDSLADMVTFGLTPAVLVVVMIVIASHDSESGLFISARSGWMAGAVFASCCGLRLARYNVEHAEGDLLHRSFRGLPSPGAAGVIATLVILYEHVAEVRGFILLNALPVVAVTCGLLMVSGVRYVHIPNTYLRGRRPFGYVVGMVVLAAMLIRAPAQTLACIACAYALSGPLRQIYRHYRRQGASAAEHATAPTTDASNASFKQGA